MGCNTCRSECGREDGCGTRKATQKEILDELTGRLYPTRRWGEADARASVEDGLSSAEVLTLAQLLSTTLRVPAYVMPGGEDDHCSFIYLLCLGREPSILELREGQATVPDDSSLWLESDTLRERYLRVACSTLGRLACVQEVAMELSTRGSDCPPGMAVIRELPQPGVFEPMLLKRFQRTVDLLMAHGVEHLDMGLLDVDAEAFALEPGPYVARFGTSPALLNYLFYASPVLTATATYLTLPASIQAAIASSGGAGADKLALSSA